MKNRYDRMIEAAVVQMAWFISMGVMLGLFVVHTAGHLKFIFILTSRSDLTLICLHLVTFALYTAATMLCVMIYGRILLDGHRVRNQLKQRMADVRAGRCDRRLVRNRSSKIFWFFFTGIPGYQNGIRISLEILALGLMFLSRDMMMMHDFKLIDARCLISGIIVFTLVLGVIEFPFIYIGHCRRQEINRRRKLRNHAQTNFFVP